MTTLLALGMVLRLRPARPRRRRGASLRAVSGRGDRSRCSPARPRTGVAAPSAVATRSSVGACSPAAGPTGHVAPLLALADCLRRRDPTAGHRARHRRGPRGPAGARARGYDARALSRGCRCRGGPSADLGRLPGRLRSARRRRGARASTGRGPRSWSASAATSRPRPTWPPARLGLPIVVHEAERPARAWPTGSARGSRRYVATTFPGTPLRGARVLGMPLRQQITDARPGRPPRRGARPRFGLDRGRPTLLVSGGSLGAQRLNETFGAARRTLSPPPASRCCTSTGPGKTSRCRSPTGAAGDPPYVAVRVPRPDGPGLRRRRPGASAGPGPAPSAS